MAQDDIAKGTLSLQSLEFPRDSGKVHYRTEKIHPGYGPCRTFDSLEFLAELTMHIAQPYERITNYHGRYSNRSRGKRNKDRRKASQSSTEHQEEQAAPATRRNWARLIKKIYEVDPLVCPDCGGNLKAIALVDDPDVIYRILKHCNLLEAEGDALWACLSFDVACLSAKTMICAFRLSYGLIGCVRHEFVC
ncbi:hypothetical protein ACFLU6_12250 [Acidobacteriota bacterium]